MAESYWHQTVNNDPMYDNYFPVAMLPGVAHHSFMNGTPSKDMKKYDLSSSLSNEEAFAMIVNPMSNFIYDYTQARNYQIDSVTKKIMEPLVAALEKEGGEYMKPPCNKNPEINPTDPTCMKGSPYIEDNMLQQWVGTFKNSQVTLVDDDNYHPAAETIHYHHPDMSTTCSPDNMNSKCTVTHVSITENVYDKLNEEKLG